MRSPHKFVHPWRNSEIFPAAQRKVNLFYLRWQPTLALHIASPLTCISCTNTLALPIMTEISPFSTIAEMAAGIRSKQVSPVEIVDTHLRRIESLQHCLNAFVHLAADSARAQARSAEDSALKNQPLGPLHGVPLTIKSCIDVASWPCPAGSLLRKDYLPRADAPLVARLKAAGAILLGNTNTPEFLMAYETNNLLTGKTSNPWNLAYSSGGSSGGEAAAIAAGCSMGGVGSDGGGSIRVPAHFCGICGLKPTPGRVPATGHFPSGAGAFGWIGVVGPVARTIADVRALFKVMAGPDAGDAHSAPVPLRSYSQKELRTTRIGLLQSSALGKATPETRAAVDRAAKLLSDRGFPIEPFELKGLDRTLELWWFFFGPVIAHLLNMNLAGHESQLSTQLSPMLREYLSNATSPHPLSLDQFIQACAERDLLREKILRQMDRVPILLSPVSSAPAFRHGDGNYNPGTGYRDTMRFSQWLNLAGLPGASVPISLSAEGLPIGVQIIGRPFDDELVLSVAEALEHSRGRWQLPPIEHQ
jgi:Asp-tRNA(Asn)/Glu-tRNA(Gln) amidotransferase A subunit family amidase